MRPWPPWLRATIHSTFVALWSFGAAVVVLKHFFQTAAQFGPTVHPWQPTLLEIHGILAVPATYLFGWICADHVAPRWRYAGDRKSGLWVLGLVATLVLTGFAAFFLVGDSVRTANGTLHEILGLSLLVPWLAHATYASRRRA